jgi:hypothetical protein
MYYDFIVFDWNPVAGLGAWYILSTMANLANVSLEGVCAKKRADTVAVSAPQQPN